jgi:hypothetical protein
MIVSKSSLVKTISEYMSFQLDPCKNCIEVTCPSTSAPVKTVSKYTSFQHGPCKNCREPHGSKDEPLQKLEGTTQGPNSTPVKTGGDHSRH